jgi:hypothetical protein
MNPFSIVTRVVLLLAILLGGLKLMTLWNQKRHIDSLIADMRVMASEASYFNQFDADEATRTLVRLTGLMWRAEAAGLPPAQVLDRLFGTEPGMFESTRNEPEPPRQRLIRENLAHNRDALRKLGYPAGRETFDSLDEGILPILREGPFAGGRPVVHRVIDPAHSPGLDRLLVNFEIRPPGDSAPQDDLAITRARRLVRELGNAGLLDHDAVERIIKALEQTPADAPPSD